MTTQLWQLDAVDTALLVRSAKGLMRDAAQGPCVLQLAGQRTSVEPSSHARPEQGRLVVIGLRGQFEPERARQLLRQAQQRAAAASSVG